MQVSQRAFTAAEVSAHCSRSDCWLIIGGLVYDVTGWVDKHPGGQGPLLKLGAPPAT